MAIATGVKKAMQAKTQMTSESWIDFDTNGSLKLITRECTRNSDSLQRRMTLGEESTEVGTESSCDSEKDHSDVIFENRLLPSIGSADHFNGSCHRCCFFPKGRCHNGYDCDFCHFEHEKSPRKKLMKVQKAQETTPVAKHSVSLAEGLTEDTKRRIKVEKAQESRQAAKHNVAVAEGVVKRPPAGPPGFFGPLPPGLEDTVAPVGPNAAESLGLREQPLPQGEIAALEYAVRDLKNIVAPWVSAHAPVKPPGCWASSKARKELPQPQQKPASHRCDFEHTVARLDPTLPVKKSVSASQRSVAGLDPTLPVKKSVSAFLCDY
jgi:hypothetical protein